MDFKKLQEQLKDPNPKNRAAAVKDLVNTKSKTAGKILVQALKVEKHEKVRERIQKGIQFLKKNLGGEGRAGAPQDSSASTSSSATSEDVQVPAQPVEVDEAVLDKVREALESGEAEQEKKALGFILKNCCTVLIPDMLEIALDHEEKRFTTKALTVLGKLKRSEFVDDIIDFLKHDDPQIVLAAYHCLESLGSLGDGLSFFKESIKGKNETLVSESRRLIKALIDDGDREAEEFLKEFEEEEEAKRKAAEFVPFVPEGMEDLIPTKKEDEIKEKKEKAKEKKKEAVVTYRYKNMLESEESSERIEGMMKLAEAKDPEAVELIVQKIANEPDTEVIATGLTALGNLGSESAVPSMQNFLTHEDDRVRANCVEGINQILGDERPKPMLERMLKDSSHRVRANAIIANFLSNPNGCFLPLNALANSSDDEQKVAALICIERFQQDTHLGMIYKFYTQGSDGLQKRARQVLDQWTGDQDVVAYILNRGDNFNKFYAEHQEKKKIQKNREEAAKNQDDKTDSDGEGDSDSLFGSLMSKLKR